MTDPTTIITTTEGSPTWGAILQLIGLLLTALLTYLIARMKQQSADADRRKEEDAKANVERSIAKAAKVDEVATKLEAVTAATDAKLASLADVASTTHTLVNSAHGQSLKVAAVALRRIAAMTGDPGDAEAAAVAEKALAEHDAKGARA